MLVGAMDEPLRAPDEAPRTWTPLRVMIGIAVFALGILVGAAIAAWVVPPA
jgi:hypothetical protein